MVNFRFHLVSIVAVFLALALGIGMGATVIDQATVDQLRNSLDNVRNEVNAANQRSDRLQTQLDRSNEFDEQSTDYVTDERLAGVDIVALAVRGIDEGALDETLELITIAGANVGGTLWFTDRAALGDSGVIVALQRDLGTPNADANQLRQAVLARISAVVAGATPPASLDPLIDAGVLEWEGASSPDIDDAPFAGSRILVSSGVRAEVANEQIARPLVRLLSSQPSRRVVAIEAGRIADDRNTQGGNLEERAVFLSTLRDDNDLDDDISTVDNIEMLSGRIATVLALSQLPDRVGDYGVGNGARSQIPPAEQGTE